MRISDWSSDVCSSDLGNIAGKRAGLCRPQPQRVDLRRRPDHAQAPRRARFGLQQGAGLSGFSGRDRERPGRRIGRMMTISSWEESFSHIVSLALAYALALPVGWHREKDDSRAGIRTFPLVPLARCGFVLVGRTEARLWRE